VCVINISWPIIVAYVCLNTEFGKIDQDCRQALHKTPWRRLMRASQERIKSAVDGNARRDSGSTGGWIDPTMHAQPIAKWKHYNVHYTVWWLCPVIVVVLFGALPLSTPPQQRLFGLCVTCTVMINSVRRGSSIGYQWDQLSSRAWAPCGSWSN